MLIDDELPTWERRVVLAETVDAAAQLAFEAIRRVDFFESPIIAVPNRARTAFDRIVRSAEQGSTLQPKQFRFEQLLEEDGGFHLLAENPGEELVLGFIGRWWQRGYGRVDWTAAEFREFNRPGYAVGAWGFTVLPYGSDTSVVVTDVRVRCTDDEARRNFRRYWRVVGPFVTAMGRPVLRLIRKEAERMPEPAHG
jgi:hypothetical protein